MTTNSDNLDNLNSYTVSATELSARVSWHGKRQENQKRRRLKSKPKYDPEELELEASENEQDDGHVDFLA